MIRPRTIAALTVAVLSLVWQSACGGDSPTQPTVTSVTLSPEAVEVIQGGEVQVEATLADDAGGMVSGATVQWSSDEPSIATVDPNGMVRGESVGATKIRATYGDVSGVADVSVLPPPSLAVSQPEVAMSSGVGGDPPDPRTLDVTNSGGGPIEGLSATVEYPSDPTGWLIAELGGTSAPTTITLTVVTQGLQAGVHAASVSISSTTPGASAMAVPVTLTLGGLVIQESDGATAVSEDGGTDEITVGLALQPETNVVLAVSSSDAGEVTVSPETLTFTPDDWDVAQTVTLTGVDDIELDGDQTSVVTLGVDAAASDAAFAGLPDQTISVTTTDDDAASIVVTESAGSTLVDENGATDDFTVALSAQPVTDVVLTVTSADAAEATVSPATLTFTTADWNVAQTVTVTGVDDVELDGDQAIDVTVAVDAAASDDAYDAAAAQVVVVTVTDDDAVGVSEDVPQGHPGVSAQALVASYDMSTLTAGGQLRDFSGNDLHGTISGTTAVNGVRGGARSFSGDPAERIALPSATEFDLDGPLTVAAWFRIDTPNQHQHVIACDDKFVLWLKASDQVRIANTRSDYAETVGGLSSGDFHSVVGIFRGTAGDQIDTSNLEIWIDGALEQIIVGSAVSPPVWRDGVLHPSDACYIGFESHQGRADHVNLGFYGVIDEVLVFGRALTPAEVALLAGTTP